ncbi:MAG TPA: LysM peptidoglycan-binding domain-containing protein [Clostridiales bacterium]|nr:LysM peptidoglycan-binding domain-containing protein [Clostridiales bacterium]
MTVYTVQPGDTIYTIAGKFNVPYMRLLQQNITQPNYGLVVGQNLFITYPEIVYYVQDGDTLQSIAEAFGVSIIQLLQNNPQLSDRGYLNTGEEVIISYAKEDEIEINAYVFPHINIDTLKKTLPFLTYLSITGYQITATGDITVPDAANIIELARGYGVAPLMMCSTLNKQGIGSYEITHKILNDNNVRNNYINNIVRVLRQYNLSGINFGCQYILQEDLQSYIHLMAEVKLRLQDEGYIVIITIVPSTHGFIPDGNIDSTYFYQIGQIADRVILISYQWTYAYMSLVEQTTIKFLERYVQYAVTQIPPEKILVGITRVAYDWELPYVENKSHVNTLTNSSSLNLAYDLGANVMFDEETQTPYFYYTINGIEHFVWFKDAKTIIGILDLVNRYHLRGISVWSIMDYGPQTWTVINSTHHAAKLLSDTFVPGI